MRPQLVVLVRTVAPPVPSFAQVTRGRLGPPAELSARLVRRWPQALVTTVGYFPTGYFPTGYLPGSLPIGALPTEATGGGSLRGKSAADATLTKANVATM